MKIEMQVRSTTADDLPAIGNVAETTALFPASMLPDMIAAYLEGGSAEIWLTGLRGDAVAGFVFCEPERLANATWNMRAIGVTPDMQGKGVGAMLTQSLERCLRERQGRLLIVETTSDDDQIGARAFYAAKGYQHEATIREFWDVGIHKVVFWKRL